jgi:hypothetical protein
MAYRDAVKLFSDQLTHDRDKIAFVGSKAHLRDIQNTVRSALERYEGRHARRATTAWLSKTASHIHFYGKIFDVISQHHPEYVALGWGALKFFLTVFLPFSGLSRLPSSITHCHCLAKSSTNKSIYRRSSTTRMSTLHLRLLSWKLEICSPE